MVCIIMWDLIAVPTECIQEEDESSNQLETVDGASLIIKSGYGGSLMQLWKSAL